MRKNNPLIIAHRGASAHAPENTLAAFRHAIADGADGVEFDVQLSSDGVPVVIHDLTLKRTALRNGRIADLTANELGEIDVGSWFNSKWHEKAQREFSRETIPTLAHVLQLLANFSGLIYIELKFGNTDPNDLVAAVCDIIRDSPLLQIIVKSFRLPAIPEVRRLLPEVQTAALFDPTIFNLVRARKNIVALARKSGAHQLSLHRSLITTNLAALANETGMPITVWTVDDARWIVRCRRLGIRSLITNDPAKLLAARGD